MRNVSDVVSRHDRSIVCQDTEHRADIVEAAADRAGHFESFRIAGRPCARAPGRATA